LLVADHQPVVVVLQLVEGLHPLVSDHQPVLKDQQLVKDLQLVQGLKPLVKLDFQPALLLKDLRSLVVYHQPLVQNHQPQMEPDH
uniref:Uncharacterized protein n=1 Tax=Amphimedon queenslandica TaxID=400682 RepID=A0A1X7UWU8_AMPQE